MKFEKWVLLLVVLTLPSLLSAKVKSKFKLSTAPVQNEETETEEEVYEIAISLPSADEEGLLVSEAPELEISPAVDLDWKGEVIEYSAGELPDRKILEIWGADHPSAVKYRDRYVNG